MRDQQSFDYAIVRLVPRVERGEFINAGVLLFCKEAQFLDSLVEIAEERWKSLWPQLDIDTARQHLEAYPKICQGNADAGPIASLGKRERFHWLVSPRSTIIQVSPVHSGICSDPERALRRLFEQLVLLPRPA